jgi:hypothetical protein
MNKLLFGLITAAALAVAAPANAQIAAGVGEGGVGVRVGPFGAGVGPDYGWGYRRHHWRDGYGAYGYAGDCRVMRERIVTPSGREIFRTRRICD